MTIYRVENFRLAAAVLSRMAYAGRCGRTQVVTRRSCPSTFRSPKTEATISELTVDFLNVGIVVRGYQIAACRRVLEN
jgi:hypothetical protein